MALLIEQLLNGIQLGLLMFLLAAGLTLVFGIMDLVNLAHGSLYMLGAYFAATFVGLTDSFVLGALLALLATLLIGMLMEVVALRRLYGRDHLDHVLGTFGLILFFVVFIIGGIGSIRGAFIAAIMVGLIDTIGRAFLPDLLRVFFSSRAASTVAPAMSSMLIYLLMAAVLVLRPAGLFPVSSK